MRMWTPAWRFFLLLLLLLLLLLPGSFCTTCPQDCSCLTVGSIFCIQRRSSSMPRNLPALTHDLYVFQNGISSLEQRDFLGLGELQMLDLSQNELSEIPDKVFDSLTSLRNLDLSSNYITHISKDSFEGLGNLERLYLHRNRIQTIHPAAFKGLKHLLELKLQGNQISVLPALHLPALLLLDLSYNNIPVPGPSDLQTPHLESLKMAGLGLTSLDEALMTSLSNLHDLDVSSNKLAGMPPALRSVKGLIKLNLATNPLGPLKPEDFQNLSGLQELDLSSLNLQGFPADFFHMFPRLQHLTAAENPFNCLCPLAWFPTWLKDGKVELGRREETRCHFPPINAGKVLAELDRKDFGCPTTTTEVSEAIASSTLHVTPVVTTPTFTTLAAPNLPPSEQPALETHQHVPPEVLPSPSSSEDHEGYMCPPNICLNGGTCRFDQEGQVNCLCPPATFGTYCENRDSKSRVSPLLPVATVATAKADISFHHVTSTSIALDLHRYFNSQPHIRGIRLTYRNLSGPDQRPLQISVPTSYPEYTLRGLQPNCTYSVCASPLGEPEGSVTSCMKARTTVLSVTSHGLPTDKTEPSSALVPALVATAVAVAVAAIAALVVVMRRKRRPKIPDDVDLTEPVPFELEGVKTCLENGIEPRKQPEIAPCPVSSHNSMEYDVPLMQDQFSGADNDDADGSIPSYHKMQTQSSGP